MKDSNGYLLTKRTGLFRLQCYGTEDLARESQSIQEVKGNEVVWVTERALSDFYKSQIKKAV